MLDILRITCDEISDNGTLDDRAQALAEMFCSMSDDGQAKFFVCVARTFERVYAQLRAENRMTFGNQEYNIGGHLKNGCRCLDDGDGQAAIEWIESLASACRTRDHNT